MINTQQNPSSASMISSEEEDTSSIEEFRVNYKKFKRFEAKKKDGKKSKLDIKIYSCDECQATFEYPNLLTQHKLKHAKIKLRITCYEPDCSRNKYCFASKQVFQRHMLKQHGIETTTGKIEYLYKMQSG